MTFWAANGTQAFGTSDHVLTLAVREQVVVVHALGTPEALLDLVLGLVTLLKTRLTPNILAAALGVRAVGHTLHMFAARHAVATGTMTLSTVKITTDLAWRVADNARRANTLIVNASGLAARTIAALAVLSDTGAAHSIAVVAAGRAFLAVHAGTNLLLAGHAMSKVRVRPALVTLTQRRAADTSR